MKKFLFLMLCLLGSINVKAQIYYSDYSNFSDYSADVVEENDVVDVEVERRYIWNCNIAEGAYYRLGENPITRYNINVNLNKESEFSEWSREYPVGTYITKLETRIVNDDKGNSYIEYRYKERLYYHYYINTKKTDGYFAFKDGCRRMVDEYKDFYKYRSRDKIEVQNNIVITSYNEEIEDFIKSTTKYEIEGDVNKFANGKYEVIIRTSYVSVPITIKVNIIDNLNKEYYENIKGKEQIIESLNNTLNIEREKNDKLEIELENVDKDINYLKKQLEDKNSMIYSCKEEKGKILDDKNYYFENYNNKLIEVSKLNDDKILLNEKLQNCNNQVNNLEKSVLEKEKEIINLNNKVSSNNLVINRINNQLLDADLKIEKLSNLTITDNELEEKYIDVSKMLEVCNMTNDKLQKEVDLNKEKNNKSMIVWVFVCCLFFLFLCTFKLLKKEFNK